MRGARRARGWAAVGAASAAVAAALWALDEERGFAGLATYRAAGAAFWHGLPRTFPEPAYRMPFVGVLLELLAHLPSWLAQAVEAGVLAAPAALTALLGRILGGSWRWGLLALALSLPYQVELAGQGVGETVVYAGLCLLAAVWLALWARDPGPRAGAAAGAAVGLTLLCRTTLVLLPLLAAAEPLLRRKRRGLRALWPLLAIPPLLLAPWALMNWRLHGVLRPLDSGRFNCLFLMASRGILTNFEGDFACPSHGTAGPHPAAAALLAVLGHPRPFLEAIPLRLWYGLGTNPWLILLVAAGLWRRGRDRVFRQVALLPAYLMGVHACFSLDLRYWAPAWPILCALAAGAFLDPLPEARPAAGTIRAARLGLGLAGAIGALALALVTAYPGRLAALAPGSQPPPEAHPEEAVLWYARGRALLQDARPREAQADLARAVSLDPRVPDHRFAWFWSRAAAGQARGPWPAWMCAEAFFPPDTAFRCEALSVLWDLERGDARAAGFARRRALGALLEPALAVRRVNRASLPWDVASADVERRLDFETGLLTVAWPARARVRLERSLAALSAPADGSRRPRGRAAAR